MATTQEEIREWFESGVQNDHDLMFVVCDTFDWEDYPVFCSYEEYENTNKQYSRDMQRVMEIYDLRADMTQQLRNAINRVSLEYVENILSTREMLKQTDIVIKTQNVLGEGK